MKPAFAVLLSLLVSLNSIAQQPTELHISTHFRLSLSKGPYGLRTSHIRGKAEGIRFVLDERTNEFVVKRHRMKRFYVIWAYGKEKDHMIWKWVTFHPLPKRIRFPASTFDELMTLFCSNPDTSSMRAITASSHQSSGISCSLIQDGDTLTFYKPGRFGSDAFWFSDQVEDVHNPALDSLLYSLLPPKFLLRDWLVTPSNRDWLEVDKKWDE